MDETAPSEPSPETPEEEKPEFPGFREGEDLGSIPETGGSVEAPEEDAELAEARVDEQVEVDEDSDEPSVVDENENPADTALEDETTDTVDAASEAGSDEDDTESTIPDSPAEDVARSDLVTEDDADRDESGAAPLGAVESEGEFGTGAALDEASATATGATTATEPGATEAEPVEAEAEAEAAAEPDGEEPETTRANPFRGPGDWYVVHTYAGYENKVKTNLESRIHTMQMEEKIFDVHIPMEDVMEIKSGKKQVVQRKVFPGYLLVKMVYDNDSWYVVRNTPGVTGFVSAGTGTKPTPLSKREVEKILAVKKEEVKPQFRLEFEEGDVVRIISGPFADFNGTISEINLDQSKLKVLVNIFDRETPVELGFDQVQKV